MKKITSNSGVFANPAASPQTLDTTKAEIASLRTELGLEPLAQQPRTLSAAKEMLTELKKPKSFVKPYAAAVKHLVSSNLGVVASLESIQAELDAASTPEARVKLLQKHAADYRQQAQAVRSCSSAESSPESA